MNAPPSRALLDWVTSTLGTPERCIPTGWPQGPSRVWRLEGDGFPPCFLKEFVEEGKRRQEADAYREWVPPLEGGDVRLPRLIEESPEPLAALLISAVAGEVGSEVPLEESAGIEVHRRAGAFLRRLHSLPFEDTDPMPLAGALPLRLAFWLERGGERLSHEEGRLARAMVGDGSVFAGDRRVPCHRDYQLRNWLLDRRRDRIDLAVIDFEHARPDHPLIDFVRVEERATPHYPSWFEAFVDGYGLATPEEIAPRLRAMSAIHAVGSIVWGARHGDEAFERAGHELLARLAAAKV